MHEIVVENYAAISPECTLFNHFTLLHTCTVDEEDCAYSLIVDFQYNEKEAEILSLSTKIEVLTLRNNELESEQSSETHRAKKQV